MTDKNDVKLESENMDVVNDTTEEQYKLIIEPLNIPYRAVFEDLSYDDFRSKFDEYWNENKDGIIKKLKVKSRKSKSQRIVENSIGIKKLYSNIFTDWIIDKIDNMLFIEEYDIFGFENNKSDEERKPVIVVMFYYVPEIIIDKDVDFKLKRNRKNADEDTRLDNYLNVTLMNKHKTEVDREDDTIDECCKVQVDIISKVEDSPVKGLTKNKEWVDLTVFPNVKLRDEIIKHKRGDVFDVEWSVSNDKIIEAQITIHDIKGIKFPEIDDILAKKEGFDSLELLKENFLEDYRKTIKSMDEGLAKNHIINQIHKEYEMPPFPGRWLHMSAENSMIAFVKNNGGNKKKVMHSVNAKDENDFLEMFKSQIYRDSVQKMIVKAYIKKFNLENNEEVILRHIMDNIEWIE